MHAELSIPALNPGTGILPSVQETQHVLSSTLLEFGCG